MPVYYRNGQGYAGAGAQYGSMIVSGNVSVGGILSVTGVSGFYGNVNFSENAYIVDNKGFWFGTSQDCTIQYRSGQTNDALILGLGSDSRTLIITETGDRVVNFGGPAETDNTLRIQSSDHTNVNQFVKFNHNQANAFRGIGTGSSVTNHESPVSLADDASFSLPDASSGWGFFQIGDGQEYALVSWTDAGVVTLISNSTNVANTDSDTDFCIFDGGTSVTVRNRLGSTLNVMFDYHYYIAP